RPDAERITVAAEGVRRARQPAVGASAGAAPRPGTAAPTLATAARAAPPAGSDHAARPDHATPPDHAARPRHAGAAAHAPAPRATVPGGEDRGASPLDVLGVSVAACAHYYAAAFLHGRGLPTAGLTVEVEFEKERPPSPRIGRLAMKVYLPAALTERQLVTAE